MTEAIIKMILWCVLPSVIAVIVAKLYVDCRWKYYEMKKDYLEQKHYEEMKKNDKLMKEVIRVTDEEL